MGYYKAFVRFIFQYIYEVVSGNKSFLNLNWGKMWQLTVKMEASVCDIKVLTESCSVHLL